MAMVRRTVKVTAMSIAMSRRTVKVTAMAMSRRTVKVTAMAMSRRMVKVTAMAIVVVAMAMAPKSLSRRTSSPCCIPCFHGRASPTTDLPPIHSWCMKTESEIEPWWQWHILLL
jgi:hypothetical protein